MANILIIDDNKSFCKMLSRLVEKMEHTTRFAHTIQNGLTELASEEFDVVFLDVLLPDGNGLDFIPQIKSERSSPEVVIITGKSEREGAEMAIRNGAWDYLNKPFPTDRITLQLQGILKYRQEQKIKQKPVLLNREGIIGQSRTIEKCLRQMLDAAESDANVLITGETGTGKELFARAIHLNSKRAKKNFVVVDCGAMTESLFGSILFGHKKGAFTGANQNHKGLIEHADKGTLFLDEAGELPIGIQASFLRGLQEHKVRPLGSNAEMYSDFRLISATNRDIDQCVAEGKIRKDLLYRLKTISIELPPLRKRKSDIKDLANYYINLFCERYNYGIKGYSREFIEMMMSYNWPGNVRELANAVELAVCSARNDDQLYPIHLPSSIRIQSAYSTIQEYDPQNRIRQPQPAKLNSFIDIKSYLSNSEKAYLKDLAAATSGNINEMCQISGLSRSRLYQRLKDYGISRDS